MKKLYVIGPARSGKTAVCVGIALKCREEGLKVKYFKPVGIGQLEHDEDAVLMKAILGMDAPMDQLVAYSSSPFYLTRCDSTGELIKLVKEKFEIVSKNADVVLIGGAPWPYGLALVGLDSFSIARELNSKVLLVVRIENDYSADVLLFYHKVALSYGLEVIGAILNHVPRELFDKCEGVYKPFLEARGCRVLGIIPAKIEISAPSVREIYEVLGGEVLVGEDQMDKVVEDTLVGAMSYDSALSYFRRAQNKAVITGGDRADIALAALETSTSVLVLTGGLYPSVGVLSKAMETRTPVILVHYDTYTTIEKLHQVSRKIRPENQRGINLAYESFTKHCDADQILSWLKS